MAENSSNGTKKPTPNEIVEAVINAIYNGAVHLPGFDIKLGDIVSYYSAGDDYASPALKTRFFESSNQLHGFEGVIEAETSLFIHSVIARIYGDKALGVYDQDSNLLRRSTAQASMDNSNSPVTPELCVATEKDIMKSMYGWGNQSVQSSPRAHVQIYNRESYAYQNKNGDAAINESVRKIQAEVQKFLEEKYPQFAGPKIG